MTTKAPPKIGGARGLSRYSAFVGQTRECVECHETKEISPKTFALHKAGPGGIHATCRTCQGKNSIKVRHERESLRPSKRKVRGFEASPGADWPAFVLELDGKVQRLGELLNAKVRRQSEIDQITQDLASVTRLAGDPAGGGEMTDERLAFRVFMEVLKPCLSNYCELGPIHQDILDALLSHDPSVCLLASRNSGKSTLTSQYVAWRLWRNPLEIVLVVSRGEALARRMLKAIRGYMELSPLLRDLLPEEDQLDSAHQLEIAQAKGRLGMSVSLTCRGIGGNLPGLRATLIIGDDVEGTKDDTPEAVDRLEEIVDEFSNIGSPGCEVKMLGTPQSEFSLYGRLSRSEAWTVFTARMFDSDYLDGREVFHSRWPDRWTTEDIEAKKRTLSKRSFALHWRIDLSETADDVRPLRLSDLPVLDAPAIGPRFPTVIRGGGAVVRGLPRGSAEADDEWRGTSETSDDLCNVTQTIAAVDPASGLAGRDAIGVAVVSITESGNGIVRHCSGVRAATTNLAMQQVAAIIARYQTNTLLVEEVQNGLFGSSLMAMLAARGFPLRFERVHGSGVKKGKRIIESISPALASGRVFISKDVLTAEDAAEFVIQYTGIREDARKLRNDDVIDALAFALGALGDVLSVDQAELIAGARTDLERLKRLPRRVCLLNDEELEMYAQADENMLSLRGKIDHVLEVQRHEALDGKYDPALAAYLENLQDDLSRINTGVNRTNLTSLREYARKEHEFRKDNPLPLEMEEAA